MSKLRSALLTLVAASTIQLRHTNLFTAIKQLQKLITWTQLFQPTDKAIIELQVSAPCQPSPWCIGLHCSETSPASIFPLFLNCGLVQTWW